MKQLVTRPALGFLILFCGFYGVVFAVSSPTAFGQACSSKPLLQGHVCTKPGARCSPVTVGGGDVGKCTVEGLRAEALTCECQGSPTPSYNISLSGLTPAYIDKDAATSTITVTPFNGFTGKVEFTCSVSGLSHPAPSCPKPPSATVTGGGSATSLLKISATSSTGDASFTVTVDAMDAHGRPPDNGAQSSMVLVSHSAWIIGSSFGGVVIALVIFSVLLVLWGLVNFWRDKRAGSQ